MRISPHPLAPLIALVAAACGGSGVSGGDNAAPDSDSAGGAQGTLPANADIIGMVYDNNYTVPDGFYIDERATTGRSFTLHHVLDESGSFELCSDNITEALAWEDADNASRAVQGYFVEAVETERYFEVARELSYDSDVGNIDDITSPGFARVFKCNHTNRNGVDRHLLSGYAGRLNVQLVEPGSLRVFAEYLWQFAFFPTARRKVVGSVATSTPLGPRHTLQLAFATSQGPNQCDRIEVAEWRFTADRQNGEIQREFETVRSFEAVLKSGVPQLCD